MATRLSPAHGPQLERDERRTSLRSSILDAYACGLEISPEVLRAIGCLDLLVLETRFIFSCCDRLQQRGGQIGRGRSRLESGPTAQAERNKDQTESRNIGSPQRLHECLQQRMATDVS